jgi:hypothetical protein
MATYLQGVTDYIPQIQPFRPDYNFLGNILQTKQSKYDTAKRQVSDLYGSLLNGPMSREDNIRRKDEFFKVIDNDIKRISGLDLSLQQNVDQAQNVFKGFYDDKFMVADMVKTKNHMNEWQKGLDSKNCYDQDKCGGTYNELSMRKLQYKMDEFKKVSDDESLNFDMGSYDSYYNWQKDAIKTAKASGMSVTKDKVSGGYIVRDKNGKLIEDGLYSLFEQVYGNDPRVAANYETQAYVQRKESVKALMPKYNNNEKEAERAYITDAMNNGIKKLNTNITRVSNAYDQLVAREIELDNKNGALTNQEQQELDYIKERKNQVGATKDAMTSRLENITNNMDQGDMRALINKADQAASAALQNNDLDKMAHNLSMVDEEHTLKEDPYSMASYAHKLAKDLEKYKDDLGTVRDVINHKYKMEEEAYKKALENGTVGTPGTPGNNAPQEVKGVPGGSVSNALPAGAYLENSASLSDSFANVNEQSTQMLYQIVQAAKNAAETPKTGAGAIQYLDKTFGKGKWQNITDVDALRPFIKTNPYLYLNLAKNFIRDNTNTSWGQAVIKNPDNAQKLSKINIDNQAWAAEIDYFKKGVKKTIDAVGNSGDPDYRLAKHLLSQYGTLEYSDKPSKAFTTAYKETRPSASDGDIQDAFEKVQSKFYEVYNRSKGVSFSQAEYLPGNADGQGGTSGHGLLFSNVDPTNSKYYNVDVNKEITNTLDQLFSKAESYKVLPGNLSADNYNSSKESDEGLDAFLTQFRMDLAKAKATDANRPMYSVQVQGMAADDKTKSGFTIVPSQSYIQDYFAKNEKAKGLLDPSILTTGFSIFYNKKDVNTNITKALEINKVEKILLDKGKLFINDFNDGGGRLKVIYDGQKATIYPTYKVYYSDGRIGEVDREPFVTTDLKNIDEMVNVYSNRLAMNHHNNQILDEKMREINQSKRK